MVALRLTRAGRPAVQLRRLLVAAASAGTGFLLLSCLGYALHHPESAGAATLRLAWCTVPLAATVYLALAVARTDPGTRPRPGLSAVGLGPAHLMAVSALTTALSCALGSVLALLVFLHLRGDLTGMPFDGAAADVLAADQPLPAPATLTLLTLPPALASATVALALRPKDPHPTTPAHHRYGRFGAYGSMARETFGTYARFGARLLPGADGARAPRGRDEHEPADAGGQPHRRPTDNHTTTAADHLAQPHPHTAHHSVTGTADHGTQPHPHPTSNHTTGIADHGAQPHPHPTDNDTTTTADHLAQPHPHTAHHSVTGTADDGAQALPHPAGSRAAGAAPGPQQGGNGTAPGSVAGPEPRTPDADWADLGEHPPTDAPVGFPWGVALLATGLTAQAYADRSALAVLTGWLLTTTGLVLAAPGLTHLCGRLLQSTRPGALRLLAGRVLMTEATRIGRPLGVVCAVASAGLARTTPYAGSAPAFGPLTTFGTLLVAGCTVATLLTAAVETRQCRAGTTAALLRLGAPASMLRTAAALRAAALLAFFGPLTLGVAALTALPVTR
ncbi:hypothetical protein AB0C13_34400 [Streptomyces sp. NPDC049099]|uniref:hypothetical protein n=1 Tax=Streptomyces sp. NPDC049099 TaxID=3155768 RepID=UPI00341B433E